MAYENLKSLASQVSNQLNTGISGSTFTSSAAPFQTDIMTMFMPKNLQTPDFNSSLKEADKQKIENTVTNFKNAASLGLNSQTITKNTARGMEFIPNVSKNATNLGSINNLNKSQANAANFTPQQTQLSFNPLANDFNGDGSVSRKENRKAEKIETNGVGTNSGSGFSNFIGSGTGQAVSAAANVVGGAVNAIGSSVGAYADRPDAQQLNETQESVRSAIYSGVSAIPGWGPLISAGLQLTDGLGKMLGTQMSNISKDAAEDAGLSRGFNNVVATIPGLGSVLGAFTKKTDEFKIDRERLAGVGSAYDMGTFDSAEDLSGGLFLGQRDKVNDFIAEQNRLRDTMTSISDTQKLRKEGASAAAADLAQQNKNRYSGLTGGQMAIGKKGIKLDLSWARGLLSKFQKGGKFRTPGIESNVIVEGAYHAHKNHLDEVNPELSNMTPKGIPVATEDASGNKTQVAEIEVGELILTKDLTDKLEELYKDGSDDAAIQAGILFANEIIDNTVDNKGGILDEDD